MNRNNRLTLCLVLIFAALASIPWLVPHTGALILVAFVPLLLADDVATQLGVKHFFWYHYLGFVLWNAATTFWVCNATVGGGIFAILANALQMSVVWSLFRFGKKRLGAVPSYIFLAAAWIAWERLYFSADISWPWLVLGNAFAQSTGLVQWYSVTGTLGGSLWVWAANLGIFGVIVALAEGHFSRWNAAARVSAVLGITLVLAGPVVASRLMWNAWEAPQEGSVDVLIAQPNFAPYHKFEKMSQAEQTATLLELCDSALAADNASTAGSGAAADSSSKADPRPLLVLAPETFTSDVRVGDIASSPTVQSLDAWISRHPGAEILFGASTWEYFPQRSAPHILSRPYGDGWLESWNSAILTGGAGSKEICHKSRLVVGTEKTPYPRIFVPFDNWLCRTFGLRGPLMGRCLEQGAPTCLHFGGGIPLGCAICYESVYPEYCTGYVKEGAKFLAVITNDAWWGNTPGYRQHCSYSRLRAIELRREIARCGNTGISCLIDARGTVTSRGPWWEEATLRGQVQLSSVQTPFVRHGDVCGRLCTFIFLLLLAVAIVRLFVPGR